MSPDGEWVIIYAPATGEHPVLETLAVPFRGGTPIKICNVCWATWSADGKLLYVGSTLSAVPTLTPLTGRTLALPVPAGKALPHLPVGGINVLNRTGELPGAVSIEGDLISPGSDPSTYVFTKTDSQRNLFRIPLH